MSEGAEQSERGVLDAIREIKSGDLDPKSLEAEDRRGCVAYLAAEGLSVPEIARLLRTSDRTVRRDRVAIREEGALERDPKLAGQVAGRLVAEADLCVQRIRRATRDRDTPHAVRVDGERACFQILSEMTQRLQGLGFLPSAATRIEASVTAVEAPSFDELSSEILRLRGVAEDEGDERAAAELMALDQETDRLRLAWGVDRVLRSRSEASDDA